ncbi:O-antigen ligase family protein [Aestuariibaculum sp. M13]|uniref:O-antigen ligase family protein n=1 Tax=Aestuariibaculum sp. M13 TaxID=2967132 RepID=UPI002159D19A|nr:O-antigen ligase family protein [Aestuariibaculum sp. M13]MCR8667198.1 O-antigen ligase family protein [Aestuariibaculum sp. M13]
MINKKHINIFDKISNFLIISFAFFLPVSQRISTINIVVLVIISFFSFKKENINIKIGFIYPVILYLLYCLSILYSSELQWGVIEQKASLLAFPIIFMLNKSTVLTYRKVLKWFVLGCVVALCYCELTALFHSIDIENFYFDSRLNENISLSKSLSNDQNYFFSYPFSIIHQTVYFAMYLSLAIVILIYEETVLKSKVIRIFCFAFLLLGIFQTLNKAAIIVLLSILLVYLFKVIKNRKIALLGGFFLIVGGITLFIMNPRFESFRKSIFETKDEIKVKDFRQIKNNDPNRKNFRVMLWSSAIDLIQKNPIIGIGAGGSHNRLYEVFAVKRQWYDKKEKYHAHNQYLQILLDIGILGFIPFFLIFKELGNHIKNDSIIISFILIIGINFLFESMFERYSGISFFSFFYCLFVSQSINKKYAS